MSRKILVVEDNNDLARLLELHLRDLTYDVDLTFDGDAGWTQITSDLYDLIMLDLMLPGIDGSGNLPPHTLPTILHTDSDADVKIDGIGSCAGS